MILLMSLVMTPYRWVQIIGLILTAILVLICRRNLRRAQENQERMERAYREIYKHGTGRMPTRPDLHNLPIKRPDKG